MITMLLILIMGRRTDSKNKRAVIRLATQTANKPLQLCHRRTLAKYMGSTGYCGQRKERKRAKRIDQDSGVKEWHEAMSENEGADEAAGMAEETNGTDDRV